MCCKKSACAFGEWDPALNSCKYLVLAHSGAEAKVYRCGRYDFIRQQPHADINPAFATACCMSLFNSGRQATIQVLRRGGEEADAIRAILGDVVSNF